MTDPHPGTSDDIEDSDCRKLALKYLAKREYCVAELSRKLRKKGYNGHNCERVLEELVERKLLSDRRYAEAVLSGKVRKGYGPARIRFALDEAGVQKEIVDGVLEAADVDWQEQLKLQIHKKYGDKPPESYKDWVKRARYLNDRGYSSEMIKDVLEFTN